MYKYELPYNFETNYLEELQKIPNYRDHIEFVYLPSWNGDGFNTRQHIYERQWYPKTEDEYAQRIRAFQDAKIPICIIIQQMYDFENKRALPTDRGVSLIEKYYNTYGITNFIINDDAVASTIKAKYGNKIRIILSITRMLKYTEIQQEPEFLDYYDELELFFWFNRHLSIIAQLPDRYKYILINNDHCYYDCKQTMKHWFTTDQKSYRECCTASHCGSRDERLSIRIYPEDMKYFAPYLDHFKIAGRDWETQKIMADFQLYTNRELMKGMPVHNRDYYNIDDWHKSWDNEYYHEPVKVIEISQENQQPLLFTSEANGEVQQFKGIVMGTNKSLITLQLSGTDQGINLPRHSIMKISNEAGNTLWTPEVYGRQ